MLRRLIQEENELIRRLKLDAEMRRAFHIGIGHITEPFDIWSVISENDQSQYYTEIHSKSLPRWNELSEFIKAYLGSLIAIEVGGFHFSANLDPSLEAKWVSSGLSIPDRLQKRIKRDMDKAGIGKLPYFYVIEARTKHGRSRCRVHIHGYLIPDDPLLATKFKLVLETAVCGGVLRKKGKSSAIRIGKLVEPEANDPVKRGWVPYIIKNIHRHDIRLKPRRIFFSQSLTQAIREFWALIREEPIRLVNQNP